MTEYFVWQLESGGVNARKAKADKALRDGRKPREDKELHHGLACFIEAYGFLQTCRMPTFGEYVSPIPATAILSYCDSLGWTGVDRFILIEAIRSMDNAYLDSVNNKKKITSSSGGKGKNAPRRTQKDSIRRRRR